MTKAWTGYMEQWGRYAALPLRLVLGLIFFVHGAQKFGFFGGPGLTATAGFMESHGFTPGISWAVVAGLIQLLGGLALLGGMLTRWVAMVLGAGTLVGLIAVQLFSTPEAPGAGVEFPLALIAGLVSLVLSGPQSCAIDERLPQWAGGSAPITGEARRASA
jgi:putative oxidoreductase